MTLDDIRALSDEGLIDLLADTATLGMKFVTKHGPPYYHQHFLADEERRLKSLVKKYFMAEGSG